MKNETKIYIYDCDELKDEAKFAAALSSLPEWRRQKVNAAKQDSDKRLSLGAGILLLRAFSGYDISTVSYGENGKPYFEGCPLNFSISHSGSVAVLAVSTKSVGVDVEKLKPARLNTAKRFFTPDEYALITACKTEAEQTEMFFRLWTLKESFIKATGRGLSLPLGDFNISFDENGAPQLEQNACDGRFTLSEPKAPQGYRIALCTKQ